MNRWWSATEHTVLSNLAGRDVFYYEEKNTCTLAIHV